MTKKQRAKLIDRAMRLVWSSLESHLEYTHEKHKDGQKFHRKTTGEYTELLDILAKLY